MGRGSTQEPPWRQCSDFHLVVDLLNYMYGFRNLHYFIPTRTIARQSQLHFSTGTIARQSRHYFNLVHFTRNSRSTFPVRLIDRWLLFISSIDVSCSEQPDVWSVRTELSEPKFRKAHELHQLQVFPTLLNSFLLSWNVGVFCTPGTLHIPIR